MKLDQAITQALDYESGIYRLYLEAMNQSSEPKAKRVFQVLCEEEKEHLRYLQERLDEWMASGKIQIKKLDTSIPAKEAILKSLEDMRKTVEPKPTNQIPELELLKKALDAEIKASNFYKEMASQLDAEGRELFRRFIEIEEGHEAIVRAEINCVSNMGFWFDTPEFRLEMG